jgi:hypothetical protein
MVSGVADSYSLNFIPLSMRSSQPKRKLTVTANRMT